MTVGTKPPAVSDRDSPGAALRAPSSPHPASGGKIHRIPHRQGEVCFGLAAQVQVQGRKRRDKRRCAAGRSPLRGKAGLARRSTCGPDRVVVGSLRWTDRREPQIMLDRTYDSDRIIILPAPEWDTGSDAGT